MPKKVNSNTVLENEDVMLIQGIVRVLHTPKIIHTQTSSTGNTITVRSDGKSYRLDAEDIFGGETVFRDNSVYFEIYTPERLIKRQRANHQPGPVAGTDEISTFDELPEPLHIPEDEWDDYMEKVSTTPKSIREDGYDEEVKGSYERSEDIFDRLDDMDSREDKIREIQYHIASAEKRGIEKGKEKSQVSVPH